MAFGASGAEIAVRVALASAPKSGSFRDLAGAQAARADTNSLGGAVDQGSDRLQVGLEPPRPHVVGVRNRPAHHGTLTADFTSLCH